MRHALMALLLAVLPAGAGAQDSALRALTTLDSVRGWEAVGRVDIGHGRGFCTGTLIESDLVLTAAHCLYDRDSGTMFTPADFQFLAGWQMGHAAAVRSVRRIQAHPEYVFGAEAWQSRIAYDVALLELDNPIRAPIANILATGASPRAGDRVAVISYARERAETPSMQSECATRDRQEGVVVFTCAVDFGASGSPVLTIGGGAIRVVSVISAMAETNEGQVALGMYLDKRLPELRAALDRNGTGLSAFAKGSSGAKFVTP